MHAWSMQVVAAEKAQDPQKHPPIRVKICGPLYQASIDMCSACMNHECHCRQDSLLQGWLIGIQLGLGIHFADFSCFT